MFWRYEATSLRHKGTLLRDEQTSLRDEQTSLRDKQTLLRDEENFTSSEDTLLCLKATLLRGKATLLRGKATFLFDEEALLRPQACPLKDEDLALMARNWTSDPAGKLMGLLTKQKDEFARILQLQAENEERRVARPRLQELSRKRHDQLTRHVFGLLFSTATISWPMPTFIPAANPFTALCLVLLTPMVAVLRAPRSVWC